MRSKYSFSMFVIFYYIKGIWWSERRP